MQRLLVSGEIDGCQIKKISWISEILRSPCLNIEQLQEPQELAYKEDRMNNTTIGIDVSKAKLDICFLSSSETLSVSNDIQGYAKIIKKIKESYQVERIIIEHTGNYQKAVVKYLQKHEYEVCVVNPGKIRAFAKASGIMAKTDKIDAYILAKYGEMFAPERSKEEEESIYKLRELVDFRKQLVETIKQFKLRIEKKPSAIILKEINTSIKALSKQQKKIEEQILENIRRNKDMLRKYEVLKEIKGFGMQTISVLLSHLPELGKIERNKLSALCGVAPINRDSGKMRGMRCIQGGRKSVRDALYMAAVSALRCNHIIHDFYLSLKNRGKPSKVAIVACMHKLLVYANSLLKFI